MSLIAAGDPTAGLIVLGVILLFLVGGLFVGFRLGRKVSSPESLYYIYKKQTYELEDRKNEYKHLVELLASRIQSVGALLHAMEVNNPSPELMRAIDALDSFEDLLTYSDKLHALTPVRELDLPGLLEGRNGG